ncbi:signal peptidase I [Nocardioides sp. HDW12B]|uniref:signal peptidase I n=1 Tax=Nocardioides sp. HDW12B TaxID=2714939 RepID=UPI00140D2BCF|nr:signal peptidase I [Nocardioides sp. HDW12B]QIK67258.1 signal peptidase I [Nocardioides sp. HDW12B]
MATTASSTAIRRTGRFLVNVAVVVSILVCAAWLVPSALGYERYVITGGSMSGTFEKGSMAFEKQVPVSELERGDVITYMPPPSSGVGTLVTHRIVAIKPAAGGGTLYRTKGDANADADPWRFELTAPTQPVVEHTVPLVGHAFIALADRDTRMLLVGVPAGVIALLALVELGKALRPGRDAEKTASGDTVAAPSAAGAPPVVPGQTRGTPAARPQGVPAQA